MCCCDICRTVWWPPVILKGFCKKHLSWYIYVCICCPCSLRVQPGSQALQRLKRIGHLLVSALTSQILIFELSTTMIRLWFITAISIVHVITSSEGLWIGNRWRKVSPPRQSNPLLWNVFPNTSLRQYYAWWCKWSNSLVFYLFWSKYFSVPISSQWAQHSFNEAKIDCWSAGACSLKQRRMG